jgi:hypothetical protein
MILSGVFSGRESAFAAIKPTNTNRIDAMAAEPPRTAIEISFVGTDSKMRGI